MSPQVNIGEAKAQWSRLLKRVQAGEEITIAKAGKPIARLTAIHERPKRRVPGDPDYLHPEDPMRELLR